MLGCLAPAARHAHTGAVTLPSCKLTHECHALAQPSTLNSNAPHITPYKVTCCGLRHEAQLLALCAVVSLVVGVLGRLQVLELAAAVDTHVLLNVLHLTAVEQLFHHLMGDVHTVTGRQQHLGIDGTLFLKEAILLVV